MNYGFKFGQTLTIGGCILMSGYATVIHPVAFLPVVLIGLAVMLHYWHKDTVNK